MEQLPCRPAWASPGSFPSVAVAREPVQAPPSPLWWLGVAFIGLCLRGLPWAQWCCCQTFPLVKKILAPAPALLLLGKTRAPPLPLALPFPGCP